MAASLPTDCPENGGRNRLRNIVYNLPINTAHCNCQLPNIQSAQLGLRAGSKAHMSRILGRYITYLLTPWCRVLLEKLTGLQLVKKFPVFHGTRRLITALTSVRHLSLSWASPIQSIYTHLTSCRSVLILSTHLRLGLPSGLLPPGFPTKSLYTSLSSDILQY